MASERKAVLRQEWINKLGTFNAHHLLFVDESAANERTTD